MLFRAVLVAVALALAPLSTAAQKPTIVQDDPFHPRVLFGTPIQEMRTSDGRYLMYVQGMIDRKTKVRSYQLHWSAVYTASEWHRFESASLEGGHALRRLGRDANVSSCSGRSRSCIFTESLVFELTAAQLRTASRSGLTSKLFSRGLVSQIGSVSADDIANLLATMQNYGK